MPARRAALQAGCAGVEMTRAQIADPGPRRQAAGRPPGAHPAVHPLQPDVPGARRPQPARDVHRRTNVGPGDGGPGLDATGCGVTPGRRRRRWTCRAGDGAGGDAARASRHGRRAVAAVGGSARWPVRTAPIVEWLAAEVERLGVDVRTGTESVPTDADVVVQCTGSQPGRPDHTVASNAVVLDVAALRLGVGHVAGRGRRRRARSDRRPDRGGTGRGARHAGGARDAGPHRRQRAGPQRRSRTGQRAAGASGSAHRAADHPA